MIAGGVRREGRNSDLQNSLMVSEKKKQYLFTLVPHTDQKLKILPESALKPEITIMINKQQKFLKGDISCKNLNI